MEAVGAFGIDVDFAQLIKIYGGETGQDSSRRYSPAECTGIQKRPVTGKPVLSKPIFPRHTWSGRTSMRMGMLRFTRLTNAFSKKLANHVRMLSLYFVHYSFVRLHKPPRMMPAMAAGLCNEVRDMDWVVGLIDVCATEPNRPKTYRKRISS